MTVKMALTVPLLPSATDTSLMETEGGSSRGSQASPTPSWSVSVCAGLATSRQLSLASGTPSLSSSKSQASPTPSASESVWSALTVDRQLSVTSGTPSPSESKVGRISIQCAIRVVPGQPEVSARRLPRGDDLAVGLHGEGLRRDSRRRSRW